MPASWPTLLDRQVAQHSRLANGSTRQSCTSLPPIHSPIMAGGGLCGEEGADAVVTTLRGPVPQKGPLPKGTPRLESFLSAHPTTRLTYIITSRIYTAHAKA